MSKRFNKGDRVLVVDTEHALCGERGVVSGITRSYPTRYIVVFAGNILENCHFSADQIVESPRLEPPKFEVGYGKGLSKSLSAALGVPETELKDTLAPWLAQEEPDDGRVYKKFRVRIQVIKTDSSRTISLSGRRSKNCEDTGYRQHTPGRWTFTGKTRQQRNSVVGYII